MAVPYKEWLQRTGRKGTQADAYQWKTTHGVALGKWNPDGTPRTQASAPPTPDAPQVNDGGGPGAVQPPNAALRAGLQEQLDVLPGIYNPRRGEARARAQAALNGYGDMFTWQADNPATPEDESLIPKVNTKGQGQVHRDSYRSLASQYGARGLFHSSYRLNAVDRANQELGDRARDVVNQYSGILARISDEQRTEQNRLRDQIRGLFGEDASWVQGGAGSLT